MNSDVPESDWKVFRELREPTLERFSTTILDEIGRIRADATRTQHERYLEVYRLLHDRDRQMAQAFADPRRSRMILQLAVIYALGLLQPDELVRFTPATRAAVESIARDVRGS